VVSDQQRAPPMGGTAAWGPVAAGPELGSGGGVLGCGGAGTSGHRVAEPKLESGGGVLGSCDGAGTSGNRAAFRSFQCAQALQGTVEVLELGLQAQVPQGTRWTGLYQQRGGPLEPLAVLPSPHPLAGLGEEAAHRKIIRLPNLQVHASTANSTLSRSAANTGRSVGERSQGARTTARGGRARSWATASPTRSRRVISAIDCAERPSCDQDAEIEGLGSVSMVRGHQSPWCGATMVRGHSTAGLRNRGTGTSHQTGEQSPRTDDRRTK